jgi:hypothetical protein
LFPCSSVRFVHRNNSVSLGFPFTVDPTVGPFFLKEINVIEVLIMYCNYLEQLPDSYTRKECNARAIHGSFTGLILSAKLGHTL